VNDQRKIRQAAGFSMLELLCVMGIILVLASLMFGPITRVLGRVLADQWSDQAENLLHRTVHHLNQYFQGMDNFPLVTLDFIEAKGLLKPDELSFLKDRRVTFIPFAGSDPDNQVVIAVQLKHGFWTEAGEITESKQAITRVP
jgi:prepilin-type N-terminal cleavage/methylation domain-containing protein